MERELFRKGLFPAANNIRNMIVYLMTKCRQKLVAYNGPSLNEMCGNKGFLEAAAAAAVNRQALSTRKRERERRKHTAC